MKRPQLLFGIASAQGKRDSQEDAHFTCEVRFGWVCGLFDGHSGSEGSAEAARLMEQEFVSLEDTSPLTGASLTEMFHRVHGALAGKDGGTTALVAHRNGSVLTCVVAGDSHCVVVSSRGAVVLNRDHRLNNSDEHERIERAGGTIVLRHGCERVLNVYGTSAIMVTRAFNDPEYGPAGLIPDPEVVLHTLGSRDRFCCLLCDGIWESLSNDQIASTARGKRSPQRLAEALVQAALAQGSTDNVTAVVVKL